MKGNPAAAPARTSGDRKAKDPRKHHYVPVFYQNNFTNGAALLWVYDRQRQTYKELHPRAVCFEKDLYAVKPENKPRDMQVETKILSVVDSLGSRGIRDFQIGKPNSAAEQEVAFFMAFQWNRVPTISRDIRLSYAKAIEELSRITFANVERAKIVMEQHERETGEVFKVTPESMVESVRGKQFEIVATETAFLTTMIKQAQSLTKVLLGLNWEVLVSSEETGFIICDCPVVVVPPKGSKQVGFLIPGSAKYLPLSGNLCLRIGEPGRIRRHRKIDKEDVRTVNLNMAANSERFIMGPSRVQLENIVSRSASERMESTPRFTIETVESDEDGALQKLSSQLRRYFYPKGGVQYAP
jgi:hypothetical protein